MINPLKKNANINVLIADDDATTRYVLRLLLQEHLFNVVGEAADGEKALEMCASLRPHVVFMDIQMPKMNGNEATQEIRRKLPQTGIIMVSAISTMDNVRNALQAGANGFVVKPFTAAKLTDAIEACLKSNR
ncbi:MAG: response regulator transcription factor [Burkholderiales bacterium]|nr:response regulator transcription factor [Burkholderiales bacterium]